MKPINISIATILLSSVFFLLYFSFASCKKISDPRVNPDAKDTITYDLLKTSIYVQFVDANTNELIVPEEGEELKIKVVGKSAMAVVDIVGLQKEEYIARNGFLTFGLLPDAEFVPTSGSPINFTIIAQLKSYLTSRKEVTLTSEGDYMVKIFMINISNPPVGIVIKESSNVGVLINGVLQGDIITSTQNLEAILTIPAGIKMFKSDSNYLAGKLNITLAYFSGVEDKSLNSFPGGVAGNVLENSSINSGVFFSTGIVAYDISDSDWNHVSYIEDDSLEVSMLVSNQSYNPNTNAIVVNGDLVPYYTYKADTGLWILEKSVYITDTLYSGLYTSTKTQGLDYASFSWFEKNNCTKASKFQLSGSCAECNSVMLDGVVRKQVDNSFVSNIMIAGNRSEAVNIPFTTGTTPVYIDWSSGSECGFCSVSSNVNPVQIDDMCTQQIVELPLTDNGPVTMSINANFSGTCASDTNVLVLPSFGIWIRHADATCWRWSSMKFGAAQICGIIYGETYVLGTYYDGNWKEWQITISEDTSYDFEINFSQSVCHDVLGILSY